MTFDDFSSIGILKYDFSLAAVTSMKTGGNAKYAFFPENKNQLKLILDFLRMNEIKYIVVGFTSNVLFMDYGFDGAVVFTVKMKQFYEITEKNEKAKFGKKAVLQSVYYAEAGASLTSFSHATLKNGCEGLEFAFGIPASVGGAIYMNAGAYGGEISQVLLCVEFIDENGDFKYLFNDKDNSEFTYRHSPFSDRCDLTIVGGIFGLNKAQDDLAIQTAMKNMQSRRDKQPLDLPSCGSTFKRPVGYYAGALIEGAGLKGYTIGGAAVSEKHAGFIVNIGNATTNDVLSLIDYVKTTVYKKDGVMLEPEIRIID